MPSIVEQGQVFSTVGTEIGVQGPGSGLWCCESLSRRGSP